MLIEFIFQSPSHHPLGLASDIVFFEFPQIIWWRSQVARTAINQMACDLEHVTQARRNLLADVTHELHTPLAVLQGNLRAILDGVYSADSEEIQSLYSQTEHLGRLLALAEADHCRMLPR
jgi:signal transduction histidine kinase